jgi:hypothetical protein
MKAGVDLRQLLTDWPFDPNQDARIVRGEDGREILQVRTPLGIEQLEMTGRPDGARPRGLESALEYHLQRLAEAKAAGLEADFELNPDQCAELFDEGTLYYFRYLRLFQLRRWDDTIRDTTRNLHLFDFVRQYASRAEDRQYLEKWRPYIVRMQAQANAMLALERAAYTQALAIVNEALERIESLEEIEDETFKVEQQRALAALRELASQIDEQRPVSQVECLERELREAIDKQEFERAAQLRDRIRALRAQRAKD